MAEVYSAVLIRRALPDEAEALTELMMRSKAHWGYDQPFLDACRPLLTITPGTIKRDPAYCAEIAGTIAGICHIKRLSDDEVNLDDLFVEPAFIGQGVGAALWRYAVALAGEMGARALVFGVDPNARAFYEYMGAVVVGENISKVFPGRTTPQMRYELPR